MQLKGKRALVTGGTKGIGAATAIALAEAGADIAINGRHDDEDAKSTQKRIAALGRRCEIVLGDCAVPQQCARVVEDTAKRLGGLDVLVHSAGGLISGTLFELTPEA